MKNFNPTIRLMNFISSNIKNKKLLSIVYKHKTNVLHFCYMKFYKIGLLQYENIQINCYEWLILYLQKSN